MLENAKQVSSSTTLASSVKNKNSDLEVVDTKRSEKDEGKGNQSFRNRKYGISPRNNLSVEKDKIENKESE